MEKENKTYKVVSIFIKVVKFTAIAGLFYTAIVMYNLGNFLESVIIAFSAALYLIFNKLDQMV